MKGQWVFCECELCLGMCDHPVCDPCPHSSAQNARKCNPARSGRPGGLPVADAWTPGPLSKGTLWWGPGKAPWRSVAAGGAAHSRQARTCPAGAASPLFSGTCPAEISPNSLFPAGSRRATPGSETTDRSLPLFLLPPLARGWGAGEQSLGSKGPCGFYRC